MNVGLNYINHENLYNLKQTRKFQSNKVQETQKQNMSFGASRTRNFLAGISAMVAVAVSGAGERVAMAKDEIPRAVKVILKKPTGQNLSDSDRAFLVCLERNRGLVAGKDKSGEFLKCIPTKFLKEVSGTKNGVNPVKYSEDVEKQEIKLKPDDTSAEKGPKGPSEYEQDKIKINSCMEKPDHVVVYDPLGNKTFCLHWPNAFTKPKEWNGRKVFPGEFSF